MWRKLQPWLKGLSVLGIVALCLFLILPIQNKIKLGLDLQGGVRVLLQLRPSAEVAKITPQIQAQVQQVMENRINTLGVAEPVLTPVGSDRILVELPNVKNPDDAVRTLKEVAKLDFKIVPDSGCRTRADSDKKYADNPEGAYKDSGPIVYSGADLKGAQAAFDQQGGNPKIDFQTKDPGSSAS